MYYTYVSTTTGEVFCCSMYATDCTTETPLNVLATSMRDGCEHMKECIEVPRGSLLATLDVYRSDHAMDMLIKDATYVTSLRMTR